MCWGQTSDSHRNAPMNDTPQPAEEAHSASPKTAEDRALVLKMLEELRRLTAQAGWALPAWVGALDRIVSVEAVQAGVSPDMLAREEGEPSTAEIQRPADLM